MQETVERRLCKRRSRDGYARDGQEMAKILSRDGYARDGQETVKIWSREDDQEVVKR